MPIEYRRALTELAKARETNREAEAEVVAKQ
jgi:glutamate synthase (NADPH/NADH) large chain